MDSMVFSGFFSVDKRNFCVKIENFEEDASPCTSVLKNRVRTLS